MRRGIRVCAVLPLLCALGVFARDVPAAEPWTTFRGDARRTGNPDNGPGPAAPKVLWVYRSAEQYVASPVPFGPHLFVGGLGGFNVPALRALAVDPGAKERVAWSKSLPLLRRPLVSSPAVTDGVLVLGDGLHDADGGSLRCLRASDGRPLWQMDVSGHLLHLEGSPTVADGRVYIGGGNGGVYCVALNRATLDGKEMDLPAIQKLLDAKWAELEKQYEEDKKTKPDFAMMPSDDKLPRPTPVLLWQQGKDRWHVDAPVAVADGLVLAGSSFLDKEKAGDRALFALDAKTGAQKWRAPLKLNPWGGAAVAGKTVVVTGSSVGYYLNELKGAKGDVVALNLADGSEKWRKEMPGGAVACAALTADAAIVTATDGKVRAFRLEDGEQLWRYDAKSPFFAPAALAGGVAYVADLKGVVHALDLKDGAVKWKLDLGADAAVKTPGGVYAGPVVQGGRLFVATCNLEGPLARQPTVVVCIGEK
jgi:outer membrane protein assembly factor BamB